MDEKESAIDISMYYISTSVEELWTAIKYLSGLSRKINHVYGHYFILQLFLIPSC